MPRTKSTPHRATLRQIALKEPSTVLPPVTAIANSRKRALQEDERSEECIPELPIIITPAYAKALQPDSAPTDRQLPSSGHINPSPGRSPEIATPQTVVHGPRSFQGPGASSSPKYSRTSPVHLDRLPQHGPHADPSSVSAGDTQSEPTSQPNATTDQSDNLKDSTVRSNTSRHLSSNSYPQHQYNLPHHDAASFTIPRPDIYDLNDDQLPAFFDQHYPARLEKAFYLVTSEFVIKLDERLSNRISCSYQFPTTPHHCHRATQPTSTKTIVYSDPASHKLAKVSVPIRDLKIVTNSSTTTGVLTKYELQHTTFVPVEEVMNFHNKRRVPQNTALLLMDGLPLPSQPRPMRYLTSYANITYIYDHVPKFTPQMAALQVHIQERVPKLKIPRLRMDPRHPTDPRNSTPLNIDPHVAQDIVNKAPNLFGQGRDDKPLCFTFNHTQGRYKETQQQIRTKNMVISKLEKASAIFIKTLAKIQQTHHQPTNIEALIQDLQNCSNNFHQCMDTLYSSFDSAHKNTLLAQWYEKALKDPAQWLPLELRPSFRRMQPITPKDAVTTPGTDAHNHYPTLAQSALEKHLTFVERHADPPSGEVIANIYSADSPRARAQMHYIYLTLQQATPPAYRPYLFSFIFHMSSFPDYIDTAHKVRLAFFSPFGALAQSFSLGLWRTPAPGTNNQNYWQLFQACWHHLYRQMISCPDGDTRKIWEFQQQMIQTEHLLASNPRHILYPATPPSRMNTAQLLGITHVPVVTTINTSTTTTAPTARPSATAPAPTTSALQGLLSSAFIKAEPSSSSLIHLATTAEIREDRRLAEAARQRALQANTLPTSQAPSGSREPSTSS